MSVAFLANFMHFAQQITRAERSLALDLERNIQAQHNVDQALLSKSSFASLLNNAFDEAISDCDVVITNNLITDPDDAPKTNVHLHELRMVVVIPLPDYGAIYLDQRIRRGVFTRDLVERIAQFGRALITDDQLTLTTAEMLARFETESA
ncbi:MAG: hypothetical protein ACFE0Q_12430 [Anaerolineae bacterium]